MFYAVNKTTVLKMSFEGPGVRISRINLKNMYFSQLLQNWKFKDKL